jgi:cyclopropane-fatty-acyl-phospholipid synthase
VAFRDRIRDWEVLASLATTGFFRGGSVVPTLGLVVDPVNQFSMERVRCAVDRPGGPSYDRPPMPAGSHADGLVLVTRARRPPLVDRAAAAVVRRWLSAWRVGALALELPDGSRRTFGDPASARRVTLSVAEWRFFRRVVADSDVGLGESYTAGEWRCDDLVELFRLLLEQPRLAGTPGRLGWLRRLARFRRPGRRHDPAQAARDVRAHYDLGNDFFATFLDDGMTYSAAVFGTPATTLAEAQREKLDAVCRRLDLGPGLDVLDVGGGWGSFAIHAARTYGCRVRSITLSPAQLALARERVRAEGLDGLVEVQLRDYRAVDGRFDRIVSIEMFEAVGFEAYGEFFRTCQRLLAPGGRMFLQTSAYPDDGFDAYRRDVDWIRTHVFPGGLLASLRGIRAALARETGLRIAAIEDVGPHYATTLRHWRARYRAALPAVRRLGFDAAFVRTWDLYLAMCEAAFAAGRLRTLQLLLLPTTPPSSAS